MTNNRATHVYNVSVKVFFSLLIGAFSLGNATPNLQTFAAGRAAAHALWQIIDRVRSQVVGLNMPGISIHICSLSK